MSETENIFHDAKSIEELLGLFAGAASVCWTDVEGAGEYLSDRAAGLVRMAQERLVDLTGVRDAKREAYAEGYQAGVEDTIDRYDESSRKGVPTPGENVWYHPTRPNPYEAPPENAFHRLDSVWHFGVEVVVQLSSGRVHMEHVPTGFAVTKEGPAPWEQLYAAAKVELGSMLTSWRGNK